MEQPLELEGHRGRIWALCYRITGSAADADELVQETFARALERPPADRERELLPWLMRVASNASLDALRRRKAQAYIGPWLPAPVDESLAPELRHEALESLTFAFLIALEVLSPTQRAVLILRDVCEQSVEETAAALALSTANVKTSHHRARKALELHRGEQTRRAELGTEQARAAMLRFMSELSTGDVDRIGKLLARDVQAVHDGGGEFLAALRPVVSRERVVRLLLGTARFVIPTRMEVRTLGGMPALLTEGAHVKPRGPGRGVHLFQVGASGEIERIFSVVASRKIAHLFDPARPRAHSAGAVE